jgi:cytochrome c
MAFATALPAADAKENWAKHCAKCHGADGKGETKMGRQSGSNYTDPKFKPSEDSHQNHQGGLVEKGKNGPMRRKLNDEKSRHWWLTSAGSK